MLPVRIADDGVLLPPFLLFGLFLSVWAAPLLFVGVCVSGAGGGGG